MTKKKVCLIGSFAVGKTSLVRRYVSGIYEDEYLTTVGVKIDRKSFTVNGEDILLLIWDIAGRDDLQAIQKSYLQGASGFLFIADGTRRETVDQVLEEIAALQSEHPGAGSALLLLNKTDLTGEWELEESAISDLRRQVPVYLTSAKTGENVETAFADLAGQMMGLKSGKE